MPPSKQQLQRCLGPSNEQVHRRLDPERGLVLYVSQESEAIHPQLVVVPPWFPVIVPLAVLGVACAEVEEVMKVGAWGR